MKEFGDISGKQSDEIQRDGHWSAEEQQAMGEIFLLRLLETLKKEQEEGSGDIYLLTSNSEGEVIFDANQP